MNKYLLAILVIITVCNDSSAQSAVYTCSGTNVNVRASNCTTATSFGQVSSPHSFFVLSTTGTNCGYTWYQIDIPNAHGITQTTAYVATNFFSISGTPNIYCIVQNSPSGLRIKNSVGGSQTWIYDGSVFNWASFENGQKLARTSSSPVLSGSDTWYEVYLTTNCYNSNSTGSGTRTTGWVSDGISSGGPYVIPYGSSPSISLSGSLSFGNVQVGNTSQLTMTITNTGTATLTISSINYPTGFSGNWSSGNISAGNSQNVTITFAPTSATSYSGTITVNSNTSSGTNTIFCSGTGTSTPSPAISLSGSLSFGNVQVGNTSQLTMTITNTGTAILTVSSINYPTGFSGNWSSGNISAGNSQNLIVTFAPTSATSYNGTITVYSNASSGTNTIYSSGTGTSAPTYSISGTVINPTISDLSGSIQNNLFSCIVKIYNAGTTNQVGSTTSSGGNYSFSGLLNLNYDIVASYISGGITYSVKELNVPINTSNVQLKLSGNLIEEIENYNNSLGNLSCYLDNVGHTVPVNPYLVSTSNSYISSQNQIANNQSQVIESLERLCIAERLLMKYYNQAATMNNEYILSTEEMVNFIFDMVQLGDCGSLFDLITDTYIDWVKEVIELPIDNSSSPYKNYYKIALDGITDYLKGEVSSSTVYDGVKEYSDAFLTDHNLNDVYINYTYNLLGNSVYSSQNELYSGNISNTISDLSMQLSNSQTTTAVAQAYAQAYREQPGWVSMLTDVSNLALSASCGYNVYIDLLALGLDAVHFGFLSASIYHSVKRENGLVSEANQTVSNSYYLSNPNWNLFNTSIQAGKLLSTNSAVSDFENEFTNTLADINSGDTSTFAMHLNNLILLYKAVDESVFDELNGIKAAIPFSGITDSLYINYLQNTLYASPFIRFANLSAISYYFQNKNDTLKDSLNYFSTNLFTADSLMLIELAYVEGLLSSVSTPAYISVSESNIPLFMQTNTDSTIIIKIKNYGSTLAVNLYAKINFTGLFIPSVDSVFIGSLGPNQTASFSFSIHAPSTNNTISYYAIQFFANSAITNPKGGAIFSKNPTNSNTQSAAQKDGLAIYPNPANDKLNIEFDLTNPHKQIIYTLYNYIGQIVLSETLENTQSGKILKTLDISSLNNGIYQLQITLDDGTSINKKVVIQK